MCSSGKYLYQGIIRISKGGGGGLNDKNFEEKYEPKLEFKED